MKHLAALSVICLLLASCQSLVPPPVADAPASTVDSKLANTRTKGAVALAGSCRLLRAGIILSSLFVSPAVAAAANVGRAALGSYCAGTPPTDVGTALAALANAYTAIKQAGVPQPPPPTIAPVTAPQAAPIVTK